MEEYLTKIQQTLDIFSTTVKLSRHFITANPTATRKSKFTPKLRGPDTFYLYVQNKHVKIDISVKKTRNIWPCTIVDDPHGKLFQHYGTH